MAARATLITSNIMEHLSRVNRYRIHIAPISSSRAQIESRPLFNNIRLEENSGNVACDDLVGMGHCMEYIFRDMHWCDELKRRGIVLGMWSNRFTDLISRVNDSKGIYKNRPVTETIAIMMLFTSPMVGQFVSMLSTSFCSYIAIDHTLQDSWTPDIEWMIYLPQINVMLFMPNIHAPGAVVASNGDSLLNLNPSTIDKVTSITLERTWEKTVPIRNLGTFFPITHRLTMQLGPYVPNQIVVLDSKTCTVHILAQKS